MFASLALSTRYRKLYVWLGAASAFLVQVLIAVTAGHFLTLLPHRLVDIVVALLFLAGAIVLLGGRSKDKERAGSASKRPPDTFLKVYATSFIIVFIGEWGDITQITTANFVAKYHSAVSVAIGSTLGLWAVCAFGIIAGAKVLNRIPVKLVQRIAGLLLLMLAIISIIAAVHS